jgi:UDP-perosamine 4-acetyltransferase
MHTRLILLGGGGHAKVCIDNLSASGRRVAYCVDNTGMDKLGDVPMLHGDHHLTLLHDQGYDQAFVAIGDNALRHRLGLMLQAMGYELISAIHPNATISPSAVLGAGVAVMAGAVINASARIGAMAIINTGAVVDHDCVLGEATHLGPISALAGNVHVGDESFLGVGSKVIPGVTIGHRVCVGAGAVVVCDIPDDTLAKGVPARWI